MQVAHGVNSAHLATLADWVQPTGRWIPPGYTTAHQSVQAYYPLGRFITPLNPGQIKILYVPNYNEL